MTDQIYFTTSVLLQWGRDFLVAEILRIAVGLGGGPRLQWGRDFLVAEMLTQGLFHCVYSVLQWGRDFSVAEITVTWKKWPRSLRFNGAATFQSRKYSLRRYDYRVWVKLQWGRDFSVAEIPAAPRQRLD